MMKKNSDVCIGPHYEPKIPQAIKTILEISREFLAVQDTPLLPPEDHSTVTSACAKVVQMFSDQRTL